MKTLETNQLPAKADWVWQQTVKVHQTAPETRIASSVSPIEVLVSLYYGGILHYDSKEPLSETRDRFIVSKGHGSIAMYPILADLGFYDWEELASICQPGHFLGAIPDPVIPGYETVNGSLGHGLGVSTGMAFGLRAKKDSQQVYVLVGDGELHEGANWEAIMFAAHHGLDNLNLIIDNNQISMLDHTDNIISHQGFIERFNAFGWQTFEVDGHDAIAVHEKLSEMKSTRQSKPKVLCANTVKGRNIPSIENHPLSHILTPKQQELDELLAKAMKFDQEGSPQ